MDHTMAYFLAGFLFLFGGLCIVIPKKFKDMFHALKWQYVFSFGCLLVVIGAFLLTQHYKIHALIKILKIMGSGSPE